MLDDTKRETIVFAYDTEDQRRDLLAMFPRWFEREEGEGLRIVGLSHDDEMKRVSLIQEALERHSDHYDARDAVDEIIQHPNLTRFIWAEVDA